VTWQGKTDSGWVKSVPTSEDEQLAWCLNAPQPLDSWSRARWMPIAEKLGAGKFRFASLDSQLSEESRVRAIEILVEQFGGLDLSTAKTLLEDSSPAVRARTVWALGRHLKTAEALQLIGEFADDSSPLVARFALEAMLTAPPELDLIELLPVIARQLNSRDRFVRQSASRVVQRLWPDHVSSLRELTNDMPARAAIARELGIVWNRKQPSRGGVEIGIAILEGNFSAELKRDAARLVALSLGDVGPFPERAPVYDGFAPQFDLKVIERTLDSYRIRLAEVYPTGDKPVDLEVLRLLSMLEPYNPDLLDKILAGIDDKSHPTEDIHRLIVASRIPVERNYQQTEKIARTLVEIDHKIESLELKQDSNWDDRMTELFKGLMKQDPVLADIIVIQDGFGLPGHVMFLSDIRAAESLPKAIEGFIRQIGANKNYRWSNDVVFVLGESTDPEHRQLIRDQYENFSVRSAVLSVLSENPRPEDRAWYVEGLSASLTAGVKASVNALEKLGPSDDPGELFELLSAARRLSGNSEEYQLREKLIGMLKAATGKDFGFVFGKEGHQPQPEPLALWTQELETRYPEEAKRRLGSLADELASLKQMLDAPGIEGDAERGSSIFLKRSCARCHGGSRAVGPDLAGVTSRFSRQDLLTSIANPNQDVSTRYQTSLITTVQGKVYSGIIVYESVDGLILRDGDGKTYRIEASEIETHRKLANSLMPQGLLKETNPQELADLFAYLASLKK
jgi:putative heme-binding domain-containing protein